MRTNRSVPSLNLNGVISDDRSRVNLPKIHSRRTSMDENECYDNPFYIPPDEEIFKLKNQEKEKRDTERRRMQNLKVWEKGPHSVNEGKLRKIMTTRNREDEEEENDDKLNIVEAAKNAIKNRVHHSEPLLNFLNKKREMFLFQMTINQKKEQIKEFEEIAHLQEISLQNSKDLLEKDGESFKQYVERNKNDTRKALKKAEDEAKEKQKKIHELKKTQESLSSIISKNTKQLERVEKLYAYKEFMDSLTPEEFMKHQKKLKEERRAVREESADDKTEKLDQKWLKYNPEMPVKLLDVLEDSDDEYEMFFKKPTQLEAEFEKLEEKNLFIIKYKQELEQNLEDYSNTVKARQERLIEKAKMLRRNRHDLEKLIQQREHRMNELRHVKDDESAEKILYMLENAIKKLYESNRFLKDAKSENQVTGFDILKHIEKRVDVQLRELEQVPHQRVLDQYKVCMIKRREEANENKKKKSEIDQKNKLEIIKKRMMSQRRTGRPIMAKSLLQKTVKEDTEVDVVDEEEIEKQLYFTVRFQ